MVPSSTRISFSITVITSPSRLVRAETQIADVIACRIQGHGDVGQHTRGIFVHHQYRIHQAPCLHRGIR